MDHLKKLQTRLASGSVDRRSFMRGAVALGLTVSAATSIANKVEAATPNKGGLLRVGMAHGSTTDSLDPATTENGMMTGVTNTFGSHLTEVGNDGQLANDIAESVEASADAKTWMFKIRKGVEFHNGKTLTPEDVVASLNHHRGEDTNSAAKGLLESVEDITVDGDTVVVKLSNANADFPFIASDYHLRMMASDGEGNVDPLDGIGTGAYKLDNFEPGVRAEFTKHANYYKENRGHFDGVQLLSLIDTTARQNAVMNGDVDAIDRVDPKTVALLARVPSLKILETTGTLHYTFPMRLDVTPFENYHLRMALKLSIKRQEMVDKILLGHGVIGNDHPISIANRFHNDQMDQREYDADKAAFHFKESGLEGTTIQLSSSDAAFAGAVDAAQLIAASAGEAGINIEVVREPKDGYWSNVWNKKGWCSCYWGGRPTEDWMYQSAYVEGTEWNDTAWRNTEAADRFNEIVVAAQAELDVDKRRAMYFETQELISNDGGAIVPMFANHIEALAKNVMHDEKTAGNWEMDGLKMAERWWFA